MNGVVMMVRVVNVQGAALPLGKAGPSDVLEGKKAWHFLYSLRWT
jgi:hypothetical protein